MGWQVLDLVWSNSTFPIDNKQEFASTEKWSQTGAARKKHVTRKSQRRYVPNSKNRVPVHHGTPQLPWFWHSFVPTWGFPWPWGYPKNHPWTQRDFPRDFPVHKNHTQRFGVPPMTSWKHPHGHHRGDHTWSSGRCLQRSDPTISRPLLGSSDFLVGRGSSPPLRNKGFHQEMRRAFIHWMIKKQGWNLWRNMDLMKNVTWYIQPMNWMF